ncbi:hypothetical protein ACFOTA_17310 [Chitinophaga sp. GCM10012297]|uniref:SGNH hydrolase-type esterase domain-containing protein n=1 Tax=Chitinophaga chungangae TaxID=2821488 RepID=A0ABS3YH09_9BACT|nr:hypothetical protein [Chitinophaga chungangae]
MKLFPDSVVINGELVLKNQTAGTPGYLYNPGNGQTQFRQLGASVQFTVGSSGFPQAGDSIFQHNSLRQYFIKVLRNGLLQYRDTANGVKIDEAAGKITFYPALEQNEQIFIEAISGISFSMTEGPGGPGGPGTAEPQEFQLVAGARDNGNSTFTLRWASNAKTLYIAPRIAGLGSSTLAGHGLSSPNRLEDKITGWLGNNTSTPSWRNLAVTGYSSGNILPSSEGGITGRNVETALAGNPDFIFVSLPSNDPSAGYTVNQSIVNLKKIDTFFSTRGIPVFFQTTQPRTSYNASQQLMLKQLGDSIRRIWPDRYVEAFNDVVDPNAANPAVILPQYDQGDGIHLTAAGNQFIADHLFDRWLNFFQPVKDIKKYIVDSSATGTSWALFTEETDQNVVKKQYARPRPGKIYFRVRAEYRNGTLSPYSNIALLDTENSSEDPGVDDFDHRFLIDLGGDGALTLNAAGNPDGWPSVSPDYEGKYWNNWAGNGTASGFVNGSAIGALKTSANEPSPVSIRLIGTPQGSFVAPPPTEAINYNGFTTQVGDYPKEAVYDNMFIHSGVNPDGITLRIKGLHQDNTYFIKLWGARRDAGTTQRTMQAKLGTQDWSESKSFDGRYSLSDTAEYERAIVFKNVFGVDSLDINIRVGGTSTFAHLGVLDIGVMGTIPPFPHLVLRDTSTLLSTVSLTTTPVNGAVIDTYQWMQVSGPNTTTIANGTSTTANISGLTNGTFVFRVIGRNNTTGDSMIATSIVKVFPDNNNKKTLRAYFSKTASTPVPGWFNVFGNVTNEHIVKTDPETGWTVDNVGGSNTLWSPLAGANANNTDGAVTGDNSGVVPDIVSKAFWFNYSLRSGDDNLLLKGLNPSKTYNLSFYSSHKTAGISTPRYGSWKVNGGTEQLLNALGNTANMVTLTNVSPDANGVIKIQMYAPTNSGSYGGYSIMNALILQEN